MATPLQHIHCQNRRVGHLHKEDFVTRDLRNCTGISLERQGVEAVEQHTQIRVVDVANQIPDLLPRVDVAPPRQRFVTNAQVARASPLGQQAQVIQQNLPVTH